MTNTKMLKILEELIKLKGENYIVFAIFDYFALSENKLQRDLITLGNLKNQFTSKTGVFYENYKVTSDFRRLEKFIRENNLPYKINSLYRDSYVEFCKQFKEKSGEDWEKWVKDKKNFNAQWRSMIARYYPCYFLINLDNLDEYGCSKGILTPHEVKEEDKKVELKVGDIFVQAWEGCTNPIHFEVLSINREKNYLRVNCTSSDGYTHEEEWTDLDVTEMAFETGEYKMVSLN